MTASKNFAVIPAHGFFRDRVDVVTSHRTLAAAKLGAKRASGETLRCMVVQGTGGFSKGQELYAVSIGTTHPVVG
jgi:hypothetical protein